MRQFAVVARRRPIGVGRRSRRCWRRLRSPCRCLREVVGLLVRPSLDSSFADFNPEPRAFVPAPSQRKLHALTRALIGASHTPISLRFRKKESHDRDRRRPRPPDPRQPRQSDGRGRRHAGRRQHGPRGGAVGRIDRRARGGRAARRRQEPLGRQGRRARRSQRSTARSPRRSSAATPRTRPSSTRR